MIRGTVLLVVVGIVRVWVAGPVPAVPVAPVIDELPALLAESEQATLEKEERTRRFGAGETLDPNRASEIQLDRLPGVGPSLARAIVEFREEQGAFAQPSDLLAVRGLGPASLARLAPHLDFSRVAPRRRRSPRSASLVALNTASAEELGSVPGIGPVTAQRILELREVRGRFATLDDLLQVRGIGAKTLEKIRPHLRLGARAP